MDVRNLSDLLGQFSEHWSPKTIAGLNDYDIKLVKVQGDFVWHSHDDTDELFLVIDGSSPSNCATATSCWAPANCSSSRAA